MLLLLRSITFFLLATSLMYSGVTKAQFTDFSFVNGDVNGACRSAQSVNATIRLIRPETNDQEIPEAISAVNDGGVGRCNVSAAGLSFGFGQPVKRINIFRAFSSVAVQNNLGSITLNNTSLGSLQNITVQAFATTLMAGEPTGSVQLNLPAGQHTFPINLVGTAFRIELETASNAFFLKGYSATTSTDIPVNGLCGNANSIATLAAPITNLCAIGNPSAVLSNPSNFAWACEGTSGGTTSNCSAPRQYTVNFNTGVGSRTGGGQLNQNVTYGSAATAPIILAPTGYTFTGWDVSFSNVTANITVTAQYSINNYILSFDSGGGSAVASASYDFGAAVTAPANPTREGYTFAGWNPVVPATMPASNVTVVAQWTINSYTVTFDSNGGSAITPITADFGAALTAPADPTREGYSFIGWVPALPVTMPSSDITITAQWELNIYTVRFLDWDDTVLQVLQIAHAEAAVLPLLPEREGFKFVGWSEELGRITGNLDVRALYEDLSYEVSIVITGAATVTPEQQAVLYGRRASFILSLTNADDVVVVNSDCGASYQTGEIVTAPIFAACSISVTVYDPVQVEADITAPGPINQIRRFTVFGGSGNQRLLEADLTRAGIAVPMAEDEIDMVLTQLEDGSYRFNASRTGRYSFRFVDQASGQVVAISFDVLPYLAFTSSRQQVEPDMASNVTLWLSDEPINYPVLASFDVADALIPTVEIGLQREDALRRSYPVQALVDGARVAIKPGTLQNALIGSPSVHSLLIVDEPAPLSLRAKATQLKRETWVIERRNGRVDLSVEEINGINVSFNWSAPGLSLNVTAGNAWFDPSMVNTGTYQILINATDGVRAGQYPLQLRIIEDCPYQRCDSVSGIPDEVNPVSSSRNRLPVCPSAVERGNRVVSCEAQGVVYAEVPNLYTLALGLYSGDISWNSNQFGLALDDNTLMDSGFNQIGFTVNLDILGLQVPGESVPVMIPLPLGVTIPKDAVWRKFTNMQWHDFVEDANNQVQSAARDALGQCPVVSSDVWEAGLIEGYGCIRLIIEDGGPNDDDAQANGVIRDPGVLAVRSSYTLTFDTQGGSAIAPVTAVFGTDLVVSAPVREGYTFIGWSPALPARVPAENQTFTAQWQINQYQIRFDTAGGESLAPLTLNFGSVITAPVSVRQGYTFQGWSPALPGTMPARDLQVTAQWYQSSAEGRSTGGSVQVFSILGLGLLVLLRKVPLAGLMLLVLLPAAHAKEWFVEASLGKANSATDRQRLDSQLASQLGAVASIKQNSDTAYKMLLGYQLAGAWYIEGGWTDLGELIIGYDNLPEGVLSNQLRGYQPQRGRGVELATRYYVLEHERIKPYLRAGILLNRERYQFSWMEAEERQKGRDSNVLFGAGVAYRLNEGLALGASWEQYDTELAKTRLILFTISYQF